MAMKGNEFYSPNVGVCVQYLCWGEDNAMFLGARFQQFCK